jgi:autotransporter-associated beta strand protein
LNAAGNAAIAAVLDLHGNDLIKLGSSTLVIENADILNKTGSALNIYEGTIMFRNRGALLGGALIGGTEYGNNIDGMTINVAYYNGAFDGIDPTNGSRTSDPFNPNRTLSTVLGNSVIASRLSFRTDWTTGTTLPANIKVVETYRDLTINLNYGAFVREGHSEVGRTFDHIFDAGTVINLVGGGMKENIFNIGGGSANFNSVTGTYDHPGVTEIRGSIDNTSGNNEGTGLTKRGNRELRLTNSNANFDGDVLVKQTTARYLAPNYTVSNGAAESQFFSLSLAGAEGSLSNANSITLTRWGSLALLNNSENSVYASSNNNDRLNDNGVLSLRNGIILLETDRNVTNTENFGNVSVNLGTNYFYFDNRSDGLFDGSFASLTRENGGVLKIYGMNGNQTWGTAAGDNRILLQDTSGITLIGSDSPGSNTQQVIPGLFGALVPGSFGTRIGTSATRTDYTAQNAYAYGGSGSGLMTLENGYIRPLRLDEYHIGGTPVAGANWMVDRYVGTGGTSGDLSHYASRNVTTDMTVNSLTISFNSTSSGQAIPTNSREYLLIENGKTLTINSGIINIASFVEANTANMEAVLRGGSLNMNGQAALINSATSWHDLDANSGTWTTFMVGNNLILRTSIVNATDLIKTGRNNLYLDTWNNLTGNVYISEQGGLFARHSGALGAGAPGREVVVGGAGNFYLEYGTTVEGIDLRATNSFDTTRTILGGIGTTHNVWRGNIIMDTADASGSGEFQNHIITARNNGTLSIYGNIYTANNQNQTDNDTWNDPVTISTAVGESATLNFRGQFSDLESGPLGSVGATGDNGAQLDRNHSLMLQMRGHDEINVNLFQQWNATGAVFATQGYMRIMYDPTQAGLDGTGFQTDAARAGISQDNQWNQLWLGGPQNALGVANSATNVYNGHLFLTKTGQIINYSDRIMVSNNNRNHTLTLGSEHMSGEAYIGSADNSSAYRVFFLSSNSERDLRVLQVRGGTLVVNARMEDGNGTADSFNSIVSMVGPGRVIFNRNSVGNSTVDRWNFMAGETLWGSINGDNQFARTRGTGTNAIASVSGWGGGSLELETPTGTTMRTQTLDGNIYLFKGASTLVTNQYTTMTLGTAARTLSRDSGSTIAFIENGNGAINFSATGLTTTAGAFLGSWSVYGNSTTGVTDWAARDGTAGVRAFTAYGQNDFTSAAHTNVTANATLSTNTSIQTLRFGAVANLSLDTGAILSLTEGGLLIPGTITGDINISGGSLTSTWTTGSNDLLLYNYGQGKLTINSVLANDGSNKVNLVHSGSGTTVLTADNTLTGDIYLNNGVLQISSDSQLGDVNGSISRVVLINAGSGYTNSQNNASATISGGGSGSGATVTFNTSSGSLVSAINVTNGGSGYTSGVRVVLDGTAAGNNAGAWAILDSGNLHFNGGVLHVTESMVLNSGRTIFLGGNGGTLRVDPGKVLTIDGFISGFYNHVGAGTGYTSADSVGSLWEASSVRNPDIGDLTIDGGGMVLFRYAPLGDGNTPVNVAHAYGGITWINDGVLRLEGVSSTGVVGALGTHRSFVDSTVIGANGTLDLFFMTGDPSIQEWLTLRGIGYEGGGTIRSVKVGTARNYNLAGQIHVEEDALFKMSNGHSININNGGGDMFGAGNITRMGNGEFRFYGNNPEWTGAYNSASGTTQIIGAGSLQGMSSMLLERNSYVIISNASAGASDFRDRLPDNLVISSDGLTRLRMHSTGTIHSGLERTGTVNVNSGVLGIEYNLGADLLGGQPRLFGDYAGFHFKEIIRQPGASVQVRNFDSGTSFAGADFSTGNVSDKAVLILDIAPQMMGSGDGANGNTPIIPGFFGGTRAPLISSNGTSQTFDESYTSFRLMTVETDETGRNYLRALNESDYKTVANPSNAANTSVSLDEQDLSPDQNLRIVGRDSDSLTSGQITVTTRQNSLLSLRNSSTLNSLTFNTDVYVQHNTANPSSAATQGGEHTTLHLMDDTRLVISSGMIQAANFGVYDRLGEANSTNANLDIRSQINGGTLDFAGQEAHIYVGGFFSRYNTAAQINAFEAADADNTSLTIASNISNANGLVKTGPGQLMLTGVNTYTGDTYINHGTIYARSDYAFGQSEKINITGGGALVVSHGAYITGADIYVGRINGNNIALALENGATWGGDVIIDNIDSAGATGYTRSFIPRIYSSSTNIGTMLGNIYGGSTPIAAGTQTTESRIFTTYTGGAGIFNIYGQIRDTENGAVGSTLTTANQNQVLRMEVSATTNETSVQLWQQHDAAGQIILKRGYLRYMGEGNFYTDAAAAALNPDNAMSGFHMGGRGLTASGDGDGQTISNLAFVLASPGATFNLSSWTVGGDTTDPENYFGHTNWGLGNTTGNSMIGGENRSGEVVFGTGSGTIRFTPYTTTVNRDLRLYAAPGGQVTIRANFVDGGTEANPVNTSITKIGAGQVNLQGSSAGASTVEGVNVLGGILRLEGYDVNADRRVGLNASLVMGGGALIMDGGQENFGTLTIRSGGSTLASIGASATLDVVSLGTRAVGSSLHFQSTDGGTIRVAGLTTGSRIGSYATFGSLNGGVSSFDWAAVGAGGQIVAFTGYANDTLGSGQHTNAISNSLVGGTTESVRFNVNGAAFTSGTLTLNDGGLLFTSNYGGGTAFATGTTITTATGRDLILHNYATGAVTIAGNITGSQAVVFTGTGETVLSGANNYSGTTHITGSAMVSVDSAAKLGTGAGGMYMNGGMLNLTGGGTSTYSGNITVGSGDGAFRVNDEAQVLILRGVISSESNPVSTLTSNPNSGGLWIGGTGTVQLGGRTDNATLVGVVNTYTGLTVLGDGVNPLRVDLQGGGSDNSQHTHFGTTDSWTDGTVVRNNVTVEMSPQYSAGAGTAQVRYREWMQFGEQAGDNVYLNHTTQRQIALDGFYNIVGDLHIRTQNALLTNGGTGNSTISFNINEGGLMGTGNIIKSGAGTLAFYNSMLDWTGNLDVRDGTVIHYAYPGAIFESAGKVYLGDVDQLVTTTTSYRVQARYGNSETGVDSGRQVFDVNREISVSDGLKQEIRIGASYLPEATINFNRDIYVGSGSSAGGVNSPNNVRFYYEDTTGYSGILVGHQQHVLMNFFGNLSGSNSIMLDANEGGNSNDDPNDQFVTFMFSGDNSAFTGKLTVGSEQGVGTNNFDRDDIEIFRAGSTKALSSANIVEMRNLSTFQTGGHELTIGSLIANDGTSDTGIYSFTSPTWDATRQTTADLDLLTGGLDPASGTLHGTTGMDYTPRGRSSAIVENASATPATLRINQQANSVWDLYFRDGVPSAQYESSAAVPGALSLEKLGAGIATMTIHNDYTGTTVVSEGVLQVGQGGDGRFGYVTQGNVTVGSALANGVNNRVAGSTGTGLTTVMPGATITGTGHVRGDLEVRGHISPGDTVGGNAGTGFGTLFVGDPVNGGNLMMKSGSLMTLQLSTPSLISEWLSGGDYVIGGEYYDYMIANLPEFHGATSAFPSAFGTNEISNLGSTKVTDRIEISGNMIWEGGNIVVNPENFNPSVGQIYNLLDWYGLDSDWGDFSVGSSRYLVGNGDDNGHLNLPDLSAYPHLRWDTGLFMSHGVLVISIVPEPSRALFILVGVVVIFFRRRR